METAANKGWVYRDRVPGEASGQTVLDFYTERYTHSSRETWRAHMAAGRVLLDGTPAAGDEPLAAGQHLEYHRAGWREPEAPAEAATLHADEHLLAVAKPSGLPVLPGGGYLEHTLLAVVRRRYADRPAPVHRLGRATSGVVLFARSDMARRELSRQFAVGRLRKRYLALVTGADLPDRFEVSNPIGPVPYRPLGTLHAASPAGKASLSRVRVVERRLDGEGPGCALVEVEIPTGRPHQIRIHLAAAGYPLVGDRLYAPGGMPHPPGDGPDPPLPGDGGYHLHAASATFAHPADGRCLTIYCRPPAVLRPAAPGAADGVGPAPC